MSAVGIDQKKQHMTKKTKSKRKAKSPMLPDSDQSGQTGSSAGGADVNKRQNCTQLNTMSLPSNSYIQQPNLQQPNMQQSNLPSPSAQMQQYPYNMQNMQTPQQQQLYQNMSPAGPVFTPPWAIELMDDMKQLKLSIPKIENIEKTVNQINVKINEMEVKMKHMEERITETEKVCTFINSTTEEQKKELKNAKTEIEQLESKCSKLNQTVKSYETEQTKLNSKLCDLESRSMRDNLLFYGLPETRGENCENLIKTFITDDLQEDGSAIKFERVHRVGSESARKPRPIVARFHEYKQRETIRQKGFDLRETLKGKGNGVGIQQPKEIRDARKVLYPIMKREEAAGKRVKLVGDKLYVNGSLYKAPLASDPIE